MRRRARGRVQTPGPTASGAGEFLSWSLLLVWMRGQALTPPDPMKDIFRDLAAGRAFGREEMRFAYAVRFGGSVGLILRRCASSASRPAGRIASAPRMKPIGGLVPRRAIGSTSSPPSPPSEQN